MQHTPGLDVRRREPEIMDDPALDRRSHEQALRGLARVNRWSRAWAILWSEVLPMARQLAPRPLRILDLATGGGDLLLRLWRQARRLGIPLQLAGCDISPHAIAFARKQAESENAPIEFFVLDVLRHAIPAGHDVISASLFLHHLDEMEAVNLLRRMAAAARHLVLVNDLRRSQSHLIAAWLVCRLLSRSSVVHHDGPSSVRAAFTRSELQELAARAGLEGALVQKRWPWRLLLRWNRVDSHLLETQP